MSTIKSSTEHLTLNADGSGKEIKLQANGVEKAKVTSTGIDVTGSVTCDGLTVDSTAVVGTMPNTQGFTGESAYASRLRIGTSATVSGEAGQGLLQIQGYTPGSGTACGTIEFLDKRDNDSIVKMVAERSNGGFGSGELHIKTNTGSDTFTTNATFPSTGGITFNGDTAAANALDDYEEGTWTPNWASLTLGNGTSTGKYVKVGRLVHVTAYFQMGSTSVMGSKLESTNLPFPCPNLTYSGCRYENYQQSSYTGATRTNGNLLRGYTIKTGSAQALEQPANTVNPFTWGTNDYAELTITYYTY